MFISKSEVTEGKVYQDAKNLIWEVPLRIKVEKMDTSSPGSMETKNEYKIIQKKFYYSRTHKNKNLQKYSAKCHKWRCKSYRRTGCLAQIIEKGDQQLDEGKIMFLDYPHTCCEENGELKKNTKKKKKKEKTSTKTKTKTITKNSRKRKRTEPEIDGIIYPSYIDSAQQPYDMYSQDDTIFHQNKKQKRQSFESTKYVNLSESLQGFEIQSIQPIQSMHEQNYGTGRYEIEALQDKEREEDFFLSNTPTPSTIKESSPHHNDFDSFWNINSNFYTNFQTTSFPIIDINSSSGNSLTKLKQEEFNDISKVKIFGIYPKEGFGDQYVEIYISMWTKCKSSSPTHSPYFGAREENNDVFLKPYPFTPNKKEIEIYFGEKSVNSIIEILPTTQFSSNSFKKNDISSWKICQQSNFVVVVKNPLHDPGKVDVKLELKPKKSEEEAKEKEEAKNNKKKENGTNTVLEEAFLYFGDYKESFNLENGISVINEDHIPHLRHGNEYEVFSDSGSDSNSSILSANNANHRKSTGIEDADFHNFNTNLHNHHHNSTRGRGRETDDLDFNQIEEEMNLDFSPLEGLSLDSDSFFSEDYMFNQESILLSIGTDTFFSFANLQNFGAISQLYDKFFNFKSNDSFKKIENRFSKILGTLKQDLAYVDDSSTEKEIDYDDLGPIGDEEDEEYEDLVKESVEHIQKIEENDQFATPDETEATENDVARLQLLNKLIGTEKLRNWVSTYLGNGGNGGEDSPSSLGSSMNSVFRTGSDKIKYGGNMIKNASESMIRTTITKPFSKIKTFFSTSKTKFSSSFNNFRGYQEKK